MSVKNDSMKNLCKISELFLSVALIGFGITQLIQQNFLAGPFPYKLAMPWRSIACDGLALLLIISGIGLATKAYKSITYLFVSSLFFLVFLYPHLFLLLTNIRNPNKWTAAMEVLAISSGTFLMRPKPINGLQTGVSGHLDRVSWYVFAFCLLVFGIQHFQYASFIETLIPEWVPFHAFWTYVVRFGFVLAALSMLIRVSVSLAMILLGTMFLVWVLILHLPRAVSKWSIESEWTSMLIAIAISGIAYHIGFSQYRKVKIRKNKVTSFVTDRNIGLTKF